MIIKGLLFVVHVKNNIVTESEHMNNTTVTVFSFLYYDDVICSGHHFVKHQQSFSRLNTTRHTTKHHCFAMVYGNQSEFSRLVFSYKQGINSRKGLSSSLCSLNDNSMCYVFYYFFLQPVVIKQRMHANKLFDLLPFSLM